MVEFVCRFVLLCTVSAIIWFGLYDKAPVPTLRLWDVRVDDLGLHLAAFGLLTLCLAMLSRTLIRAIIYAGVAAVVLEVAQMGSPDRQSHMIDVGAGLVGIALASMVYLTCRKVVSTRWLRA